MQISVVIPVYNDPKGLRVTVQSLLEQDFPLSEYEILIVDNASTDHTGSVARELEHSYPGRVRALEEREVQSSYAARNRGISEAAGEILCFIDADMTAPADYLSRIAEYFDENPVDYLGCSVRIHLEGKSLASLYNRATYLRVWEYFEEDGYVPTCCLSVRRKVFEGIGDFDSRLESSGDREFGQRARSAGVPRAFVDRIVLSHPARQSFKSILALSRRIARGLAQLQYFYPERYSGKRPWFFRLRHYLPANPIWLARRLAASGVSGVGLLAALPLSV